ncbi:MAG: hypothetical protein ACXV7J_09495 [Methylomonas sp.]
MPLILEREDGKRYNLLVAQDHASAASQQAINAINPAANANELVEGGQLLLMAVPSHEAQAWNVIDVSLLFTVLGLSE